MPKNYIPVMRRDARFVDKASPEFKPTGTYAEWCKSASGQIQIKGTWNDQYLAADPLTHVGLTVPVR